jgi:hypothetical protein
MFRRVLSGLFAAALALAGAAVAPSSLARATSGWATHDQPALAQPGRGEVRVGRPPEGRGAPHPASPLLAILPGAPAPERGTSEPPTVHGGAPLRVTARAGSPLGARAPPA